MTAVADLEETIRRMEADNLRLSGELATANERLASYQTAEAIADETRAKRYMDGLGDQ